MPTFDDTALQQALADDRPGFHETLGTEWPEMLYDTIGALVQLQDGKAGATSVSTVSIGNGSKVFVLDTPRQFRAGTPVYIMEAGSPSDNVMAGTLSADETGGSITVNVTFNKGSGTFANWIILSLFAITTVVSPPVAVADGGTGAATESAARESLEVPRLFVVLDSLLDPPASPNAGDTYRVLPGAINAWAGQDDDIASWEGAAWSFITPTDRAPLCFDKDSDDLLYWNGSRWHTLSRSAPATFSTVGHPIAIDLTADKLSGDDFFRIIVTAGSGDLTLPNDAGLEGYRVTLLNTSTGSTTVRVAGGGTIDGATTDSIADDAKKTYIKSDLEWHLIAEIP